MINKEVISTLVVLSLMMIGGVNSLSLSADQGTSQQKELEIYLKNAKVADIEKGGLGGRNEPWRIFLDDGKTQRRAIFKYIDRPERRLNPVSYKREIAAYELTKLFKMEIVPPVLERKIREFTGSLQIMVEGCINENERKVRKLEPPDAEAFEKAIEEINVFDNFTFCLPDPKDILIHKDTWQVCRVDFMEAFDTLVEFLPETSISRCSRRLYQGLKQDAKVIEAAMKPYLTAKEIKALLDRKALILDRLTGLIKEKGEDAVLFDIKS